MVDVLIYNMQQIVSMSPNRNQTAKSRSQRKRTTHILKTREVKMSKKKQFDG